MDRGIKDEAFIAYALEIADRDNGRWIGQQDLFNGRSDALLEPTVQAALVTAVNIYVQKGILSQSDLQTALKVTTRGEASALIDKLHPLIPAR